MKAYDAPYFSGQPDWTCVPCAAIDQHLWSGETQIKPTARLCWNADGLFVRLETIEPQILRRYSGPLDPVYCDSCLEFFFCPDPEDDRYFNFEINPNGAMYVGFGKKGKDRCRLYREDLASLLQVTPFPLPGGWGVEMKIPVEFVQIFSPDFSLYAGVQLRANFYKCGDETAVPHFIAWNPIVSPVPAFHLPEFFGQITLR